MESQRFRCITLSGFFCPYLLIGILFFYLLPILGDSTEILAAAPDIVINEIQYHPTSESEMDEFIELYNRGKSTVDLSGWSFSKGISFTFPTGTKIPPDGYLVVAKDKKMFQELPQGAQVAGNYAGSLNNGGEKITLVNYRNETVDSIDFNDSPPWPTAADGNGSSMERISPEESGQDPMNWEGANSDNHNEWKFVRTTGIAAGNRLYFYILGVGKVWIDDISLIETGKNTNLVNNPDFEEDFNASNWAMRGNHRTSTRLQTGEAHVGNYVLQLTCNSVSEDYNNNSMNQSTQSLTPNGPIYELSFWMRPVEGNGTLVVMQNQGGLFCRLPIQGVENTPGRRNTAFSTNLPPRLDQVTWTPQSPKPNQPVTIQVHAADTDGIASLELFFQTLTVQEQKPEEKIVMKRTSGTSIDGIWEAAIPGRPDRTLVRFRLLAADSQGNQRFSPARSEARSHYSYFHYADNESSLIPVAFLYDYGSTDIPDAFSGDSTFIIKPPQSNDWQVYDHILITFRKSGFNVNFLSHYEYGEMSGINLVVEYKARYALSEWLSYQVYQDVGAPAGKADHFRLFYNNQALSYFLMFEQPNRHFIGRNQINNEGNLYKIIWDFTRTLSSSNIIKQHEKKTHLGTGFTDVIDMVTELNTLTPPEQTLYIERNFAVDRIINYYVGCQLISDWDGYFNNHFVYHDIEDTGLWYVFPWDKDKTWGDHDRYRLPYYPFYDMPILFGANSTPQSGQDNRTWWRPPGFISGAFLANSELQKKYLTRLGYAAQTLFTPERWIPVIDDLEKRLEPEVQYRAKVMNLDSESLLTEFHNDIESFRRQVVNRRQFILTQVEKEIGPVMVEDWSLFESPENAETIP